MNESREESLSYSHGDLDSPLMITTSSTNYGIITSPLSSNANTFTTNSSQQANKRKLISINTSTNGNTSEFASIVIDNEVLSNRNERDGRNDENKPEIAQQNTTKETTIDPNEDEQRYRKVYLNKMEWNGKLGYCSNTIITSRFTIYNFLPKLLFYEFSKLANAYFLVISIMQTIKPISNTGGFPASLPALSIIVLIDMFFAIIEDYKRHRSDKIANNLLTKKYQSRTKEFITAKWSEIAVGDIVKVTNYENVPADLVILGTWEPDPSSPAGICYIETKSLDGETNLKLRQALEASYVRIQKDEDVGRLRGFVTCEQPNNVIHRFSGSLTLQLNENNETTQEAIVTTSVILRGSTVRNTEYVYGLVINTGADTKIMRASLKTPLKWSNMETRLNRQILYICVLMVILCLTGAIGGYIWNEERLGSTAGEKAWYLYDPRASALVTPIGYFIVQTLYYFLLLNSFIPVSLYVSMTSVKFMQSYFMNADLDMYDPVSDTPASVRTMSLNEELGQIDYIFSDKTGTLTCNIMEFRKCSIAGVAYGHGDTEVGLAAKRRANAMQGDNITTEEGANIPVNRYKVKRPFVNYQDDSIFTALLSAPRSKLSPATTDIELFFEHLSVCHTVMPERASDGSLRFSASSPDEQALVAAAACFGYEFAARAPGQALVDRFNAVETHTNGLDISNVNKLRQVYKVLEVLEFNSTRKRMSVIVEREDGAIVLLCKGADTVMYERLRSTSNPKTLEIRAKTLEHMELFAAEGLRTLVIGMSSPIDKGYFNSWVSQYRAAVNNLEQIDLRRQGEPNDIDRLMEEIEVNLEVLGATAIEDRLQDGVPETIYKLRQASIKIWMLTGDKEETAINIGFACQLIDSEMDQIVISADLYPDLASIEAALKEQLDRDQCAETETSQSYNIHDAEHGISQDLSGNVAILENDVEASQSSTNAPYDSNNFSGTSTRLHPKSKRDRGMSDSINSRSRYTYERRKTLIEIEHPSISSNSGGESKHRDLALVIDGETLELALQECPELLLRVAEKCKGVIACRVSPYQKAQLVELVRINHPKVRTLAIGDGANDVSMIQKAHVGIGISGQEGMQAANSSDYTIAQFRFLSKLLLVHGRWNYARMGKLILYIFYKNIMMNLTQLWYILIYTGFSGQKFFLEWGLQGYNLLYTALPIVLISIFEQDVPADLAHTYPLMYRVGQENKHFNTRVVWLWLTSCVWESLIIAGGTIYGAQCLTANGDTPTMWVLGCISFSCVVVVVTIKLMIHQEMWVSFVNFPIYLGSVALWFVTAIYISTGSSISSGYWNGVFGQAFETKIFWFLVPIICFTALSRDILWRGYVRAFHPSYKHLAQEVNAYGYRDIAGELLAFPPAEKIPPRKTPRESERELEELASPLVLKNKKLHRSATPMSGVYSGVYIDLVSRIHIPADQLPRRSRSRVSSPRRGSAFSYDAESVMVEAFMATRHGRSDSQLSHQSSLSSVFKRHASRGSLAYQDFPDPSTYTTETIASSNYSEERLSGRAPSLSQDSRQSSAGNLFRAARHSFGRDRGMSTPLDNRMSTPLDNRMSHPESHSTNRARRRAQSTATSLVRRYSSASRPSLLESSSIPSANSAINSSQSLTSSRLNQLLEPSTEETIEDLEVDLQSNASN